MGKLRRAGSGKRGKSQQYKLRFPSKTYNLRLIRDFISRVACDSGFSSNEVKDIVLAVDEACTNVIKHAYKNLEDGDIFIRAGYDRVKLTIIVSDTGVGFDPGQFERFDVRKHVAQYKVGGLGIHIMRSLMDEVRYHIEPGVRNSVELVKYCPGVKERV
ncbi:MAG: ATP-binding protein [Fidelibacterota bacterium]